jgi:hypothetical protein
MITLSLAKTAIAGSNQSSISLSRIDGIHNDQGDLAHAHNDHRAGSHCLSTQ